MSSHRRTKLSLLLVSLTLVFLIGALAGQIFAQRMPEAAKGPSVAWRASAQGKPSDYAGWKTCTGCHRAEAQVFVKTPHALAGEALPTSPSAPTPGISLFAFRWPKIWAFFCPMWKAQEGNEQNQAPSPHRPIW